MSKFMDFDCLIIVDGGYLKIYDFLYELIV